MLNYKDLLKEANELGIKDLQLIVDKKEELALVYSNGELESNTISDVNSMTVSAIVNNKKASYVLEDLEASPKYVIKALYENASKITSPEEFMFYEGSKEYPNIESKVSDFHDVSITEKIALLEKCEKELKNREARIVQIPMLEYDEEVTIKEIYNSKGLNVSKKNEYCVLVLECVAFDGKAPQVGFNVEVKNNFKDLDIEKCISETIKKATSKFGAEPIESGDYQVIIENGAMANLLGAFSGMFTGESHLKKISLLQNKLGEKVFSEKITICDEPLKEDAIVREPFDNEGVACFNKVLVDKGVFKMMLHDLKTAKVFNTTSTGSSFGPCNLYIKPGEKTKEELIKSIDKGLILDNFDGLHAGLNAISGDMSLKTSGFYIENGEITKPVTLIVATGNFKDMLNDVCEVASDLKLDFRGVGSPSIKFNKLSISGK